MCLLRFEIGQVPAELKSKARSLGDLGEAHEGGEEESSPCILCALF